MLGAEDYPRRPWTALPVLFAAVAGWLFLMVALAVWSLAEGHPSPWTYVGIGSNSILLVHYVRLTKREVRRNLRIPDEYMQDVVRDVIRYEKRLALKAARRQRREQGEI